MKFEDKTLYTTSVSLVMLIAVLNIDFGLNIKSIE